VFQQSPWVPVIRSSRKASGRLERASWMYAPESSADCSASVISTMVDAWQSMQGLVVTVTMLSPCWFTLFAFLSLHCRLLVCQHDFLKFWRG